MRLVTWNLNGLDDSSLDERTEAAVFTMVLGAPLFELHHGATPHEPPEVIVLQEVTKRSLLAHLTPHLTAGSYVLAPANAPEREAFEIVAVRKPYAIVRHETVPLDGSVFGRQLHVVDLTGPQGPVRVLTGHLDSGSENSAIRLRQLRQITTAIGPHGVFAGDANLRKAEWESARDDLGLVDGWEAAGEPKDCRYTWRQQINGESYRARYDRVLLTPTLKATAMTALGATPLRGGATMISDHIGLLVDVVRV